jgi:hypothetical protein
VVYFKERGGSIRASAIVSCVDQFVGLAPSRVRELARTYAKPADAVGAPYWRTERGARYATMIWFTDVERVDRSPAVQRLYGAAWVVLDAAATSRVGRKPRRLGSARGARPSRAR